MTQKKKSKKKVKKKSRSPDSKTKVITKKVKKRNKRKPSKTKFKQVGKITKRRTSSALKNTKEREKVRSAPIHWNTGPAVSPSLDKVTSQVKHKGPRSKSPDVLSKCRRVSPIYPRCTSTVKKGAKKSRDKPPKKKPKSVDSLMKKKKEKHKMPNYNDDAPTALIAPEDYEYIYKSKLKKTKVKAKKVKQIPLVDNEVFTDLVVSEDYEYIYSEGIGTDNKPTSAGQPTIPDDAPTCLIAPDDYQHVYSANPEERKQTVESAKKATSQLPTSLKTPENQDMKKCVSEEQLLSMEKILQETTTEEMENKDEDEDREDDSKEDSKEDE